MVDVVQHLSFALEVFQSGGRAKLGLNLSHKRRDIAVPALMPVMVSPHIVHGPLICLWDSAAK